MLFVTKVRTSVFSSSNKANAKYPIRFSAKDDDASKFMHSMYPKCVGYPNSQIYSSLATFLHSHLVIRWTDK
jgi:hypothetical protein